MDTETARQRLLVAGRAVRASRSYYEHDRAAAHPAIVEAALAGVPQREIVDLTGYTRENVRKVVRAAERRADLDRGSADD